MERNESEAVSTDSIVNGSDASDASETLAAFTYHVCRDGTVTTNPHDCRKANNMLPEVNLVGLS